MSGCKNLTGQRFGRLTVIERKGSKRINNSYHANWLCKCDCGNYIETTTYYLKSGSTRSCGCLAKELLINRNKAGIKRNKYDLSNEYGIGYTFNNKPFYFDLEDYELIKNYTWHESNGYLISHVWENGIRTTIRIHRLILGLAEDRKFGIFVDHINHDLFDNRKANLRIVNNAQNQMNKVIASNNTSTVKGVHFDKLDNKWVARISVNGERISLGRFFSFDEAVNVRKKAEEELYKDYSYENSMKYAETIAIN